MNKIFKTMMLAAATVLGIASCENVPAPFIEPGLPNSGDGGEISLPYHSANLKSGFEVHTVTGSEWSLGNTYAKATGYNSNLKTTTASETYLITPAISLGDAKNVYVNFDYVIAYTNSLGLSEGHKVLVCSDYNSVDPSKSDWITLPFEPKEREDRNSWDMYRANTLSIPESFLGKTIRIAFLYKCNDTSASTWELTNLNVSTEPGGEVTPDTPDTPVDGDAKGDGTLENPWNVAGVLKAFNDKTYEEDSEYYVKGIITKVSSFNSKYSSISYYISDDASGSNKFYIYSGLGLDKGKFSGQNDLHVGDEVVVCGKLTLYNNEPQFNYNNYLVSHKSNSNPDEETESSASFFKASDLGLENGVAFTSVSVYGITLSVTDGGNNNGPKYYDNGSNLRMYPQNTLTISTEKVISSIKLNCTSEYVASGDASSDKGTIKVEDPTITISDINDKSFTLTNTSTTTGPASQIRIESFEITYAE